MRSLVIIVVSIVLITIGVLSVYLTPNDLAQCQSVGSSRPCISADAIVAISGGNTSVRAAEAINLYKEGWSDTILFSGAAKDTTGPSNAEVMRRQALEAGVPASDILVESFAQSTKENAIRTKELFAQQGIQRIILVTSGYHQRRASLEFSTLTGDGIEIVNHPAKNDSDWPVLWWLTPRGWWLAGGEFVKIIAYYVGESR